jgi:hypothetical protein
MRVLRIANRLPDVAVPGRLWDTKDGKSLCLQGTGSVSLLEKGNRRNSTKTAKMVNKQFKTKEMKKLILIAPQISNTQQCNPYQNVYALQYIDFLSLFPPQAQTAPELSHSFITCEHQIRQCS